MTEQEAIENGIEILVILQYGCSPLLSNLDCLTCTKSDKKEYGCCLGTGKIKYMKDPVYIKQLDKEYSNCPISMIPSIVYKMMDKYNRMKELNQTLDDNEAPAMYWWFVRTYTRIKNKIEMIRHEESMAKHSK